jgi:hypothetical protein
VLGLSEPPTSDDPLRSQWPSLHVGHGKIFIPSLPKSRTKIKSQTVRQLFEIVRHESIAFLSQRTQASAMNATYNRAELVTIAENQSVTAWLSRYQLRPMQGLWAFAPPLI